MRPQLPISFKRTVKESTEDAPMEEASIGKATEENHASPKLFERIMKEIPASPKLFKSMKKPFTMTKKTGAPSSETSFSNTVEDSRNDVEIKMGEGEGTDAVVEVLETKVAVQQEDAAELRDDTPEGDLESNASETRVLSANMVEAEAEEVPSANAPADPSIEEAPIVEAKEEDAAVEAKEEDAAMEAKAEDSAMEAKAEDSAMEAKAKEEVAAIEADEKDTAVEAKEKDAAIVAKEEDSAMEAKEEVAAMEANENDPAMGAKEEVNAVKPEKDALMLLEENSSAETEVGIEAVQHDGRVALGYFERTTLIKEKGVSMLEQTRQFAESAAEMMEHHCLIPCVGKVNEWQDWSKKLMSNLSHNGKTSESTQEEEGKDDSSVNENPSVQH